MLTFSKLPTVKRQWPQSGIPTYNWDEIIIRRRSRIGKLGYKELDGYQVKLARYLPKPQFVVVKQFQIGITIGGRI